MHAKQALLDGLTRKMGRGTSRNPSQMQARCVVMLDLVERPRDRVE